jgi:hypothetical protein
MLATAISIASAMIAILSAISSARTSYQINGSGFKASQALLTDLATLLAALRSIAVKGAMVMGEQRKTPIPIDAELAVVRAFLTNTSGLALSLYAGKVGSTGASDNPVAGAWRVSRMQFTNLAAATITTPSDNQAAGALALELECTLSTLNRKAIKRIRREIKNMPNVLSSLTKSRSNDILLSSMESVVSDRKAEAGLGPSAQLLRQLKSSGIEDADIDMWLAMEDDDLDALKDAVERGADPNKPLGEVLNRYKDVNVSHESGTPKK